ncbi:hypothetical protein ELQ87_10250 [Streptomyces griseoviridis]|uniref:Uncharacterized protein n=1 Tax=Streptomyces griseoviridis TaxID=45398 RepID=A0A3Q9KRQ9_STRGD|nr:hypothetical protein [Streptomyces griseoviridis]AZS84623.1 hypothetical protein ELQ87_10250 [Streptomyces griseoviridis]
MLRHARLAAVLAALAAVAACGSGSPPAPGPPVSPVDLSLLTVGSRAVSARRLVITARVNGQAVGATTRSPAMAAPVTLDVP